MKQLTAYKLMQILLKEDARSIYPAAKINRFEDAILGKRVYCSVDAYSFDEMEMEYPELVKVTRTEIQIHDVAEFRQKLNYRLRFTDDRELEELVVETWRTM